MEFEVALIHGGLSQLEANFLVFEEVVGLDTVDAHIVFHTFLLVLGLFFMVVSLVDGHASLGGHFKFEFFGSAYWVDPHWIDSCLLLL